MTKAQIRARIAAMDLEYGALYHELLHAPDDDEAPDTVPERRGGSSQTLQAVRLPDPDSSNGKQS